MINPESKSSFYCRYVMMGILSLVISIYFLTASPKLSISAASPQIFIISFIAITHIFLSFLLEKQIFLLKEANKRGIKIQENLEDILYPEIYNDEDSNDKC